MALYLKYRPETLDDIIGNEAMVSSLKNMISSDNRPHAYLLSGPTGCGKTTTARIIAKMLGCGPYDLNEIDAADYRGIDSVRAIRESIMLAPVSGDSRVWILDESHQLTGDAANALLKILEDTPPHVYFILCTTEPKKILKTIQGRCQHYEVEPLTSRQMYRLLSTIIKGEGVTLDKKIIDIVIETGQGHPRNTINVLQQVLSVDEDQREEIAHRTIEQQNEVIELCRVLTKPQVSWHTVRPILNGLKTQKEESIRRAVLGYCSAILLNKGSDHVAMVMEAFIEPFYDTGFAGLVFACYKITAG